MIRTLHSSQHHLGWNRGNAPALHIAPGEELELQLLDASGNRIARGDGAEAVTRLEAENANPLTGPVFVEGAEAGDVLAVDILDFTHGGWGWTAIIPGFGLLADDFPAPFLHISEYDDKELRFTPDIRLPVRPFAGTIGVCPDSAQTLSAIPPHQCGGNMDFRDLAAGSRLYLPVQVEGALFSAGDGHAVQGDGEVCGTAVETRLGLRARFELLKGGKLPAPKAECSTADGGGKQLVTLGIGPDLQAAAADALRFMIDELGRDYGLDPELAYCLCSCAAGLRIAQLVNAPHWTVACSLPLSCFR